MTLKWAPGSVVWTGQFSDGFFIWTNLDQLQLKPGYFTLTTNIFLKHSVVLGQFVLYAKSHLVMWKVNKHFNKNFNAKIKVL